MSLKNSFLSFLDSELKIPLAGIAALDDYSPDDICRIKDLLDSFSQIVKLPKDLNKILQPRELLAGMKSIIIIAVPNYIKRPLKFKQCREELLGTASALHVTVQLQQRAAEHSAGICSFFTDRGFDCKPVPGTTFFPAKLMASRCGIGYYGKNNMLLHPDHGAWFSLTGFMTAALLEPDEPLSGDCGECSLCVKACPAGALHNPYQCDETRCINFHLGHNKKHIPVATRKICGNLLGQACTACKDACPKNRTLKPLPGFEPPQDLVNPALLKILEMDDLQWKDTFGKTPLGLTMADKRYLKRNAAIALGNFADNRAVAALSQQLAEGEDEIRGYAAWALGRIGVRSALKDLQAVLLKEKNPEIKAEIVAACVAVE